ncbi:MAG: radical SAM/SPASM domain-containing protein [Candidatus Omnitrophota bacterium]|nr:radical SAM/SPASM domain-containing protein [Candidatus Omnitrophota bacterium]
MLLKRKFRKYLYRRPFIVDRLRKILYLKILRNNFVYKNHVLKKAKKFAKEINYERPGLVLETTFNCNASCIYCSRSKTEHSGTMSMDLFRKIIDDCVDRGIKSVTLSGWGDPLLDEHLFERIEYITSHGLVYGVFTNGSRMNEYVSKKLLDSGGLVFINFSLGAFNKDIYENIVKGLDRDKVYTNVINFLEFKRKRGLSKPHVAVSIVKIDLNLKDIRKFVNFWAHQEGVNEIVLNDLKDNVGQVNVRSIGKYTFRSKEGCWLSPCCFLFVKPCFYVYHDGRVSPCGQDTPRRELIIGDMNGQTINEIFTSREYDDLKEMHLKDQRKLHKVCGKCLRHSYWVYP